MLHVTLIDYNIIRKPESPHVYFTSNAAVVPGSNYDLVRITPTCQSFYLLLTGVYRGKAPTATSCVLADNFRENKAYWAALQQMVNGSRPTKAKANKEAVLKIVVYETSSTAEPSRITIESPVGDRKPLGESEAYLTGTVLGSAGAASGDHPTNVTDIGLDTLTEVRVGEAVVSIDSLARLYLAKRGGKDEPTEVELLLQEFTYGPIAKGSIRLRFTFHSQLTLSKSDSYLGTGKLGDVVVSADNIKEVISFDTPEINEFIKELSKGHSTSIMSAETAHTQSAYTASEWKEKFLKSFKELFVFTKETEGGHQECPLPSVDLKSPLTSCPPHLTSYQAPLMSIDGESSVLSASYYLQPVKRNFITARFHEVLMGKLFDNACEHFGTTSEQVAAAGHAGLSTKSPADRPEVASPQLIANLRIVGYFLGLLPAGFRYREDFNLTSDTKEEGLVDIDEDTSRNLFLGLNGEDCDGFDSLVMAFVYILFMGLPQPKKKYLTEDKLAMAMIRHLCKCGSGHKDPTKCIGSWDHPGLQFCQRLLFHYTPVSVVGACVNEYPKELRPANISPDQEDYRVNLPTMSNLTSITDPLVLKELKKLFVETSEFSSMIGHRWSLAIPTIQLLAALARGQRRELRSDASFTSQKDEEFRIDIDYLVDEIKDSETTLQPLLPVLLLEASKPTNVYSICGANAWMADDLSRKQLAEIESKSRDLAMYTNNSSEGMFMDVDVWEPRGVVMASEGQAKFVVGDDSLTSLPSNLKAQKRRYSPFYKAVVSGDLPTFINLTGRQDIGICFVGDEDGYVGKDVEDVFGLRPGRQCDLICPLFRIPGEIRSKLVQIEEKQRRERIPSQLGAYSKENTQVPTWIEVTGQDANPVKLPAALPNNWTNIFRRTFLTVNMNIISNEHLIDLEKLLKEKADSILCSQFRLHPRAAVTRLYSFYPK